MGTHPIFESDFDCLTVLDWMNKKVFRPRRLDCVACNSIHMMLWNLDQDIVCESCGRQFYAPKNNVRLSNRLIDPILHNAEAHGDHTIMPLMTSNDNANEEKTVDSILTQLGGFQMNCTNRWCSFKINIQVDDPSRNEKFSQLNAHKKLCKENKLEGKRFLKFDEASGEEIYVLIAEHGLEPSIY